MEVVESLFHIIVEAGIIMLEFAGVGILLVTAVKCIIHLFQHDPNVRLSLAQGIALALEFKLGGEVLRTVIAREWSELAILGAIIALRGALTFLIHWEIKTEESKIELNTKKDIIKHSKKAAHSAEN
jgi:Predicted membrane protein